MKRAKAGYLVGFEDMEPMVVALIQAANVSGE